MAIHYSEHAPRAGLADAVRCFWTIQGDVNAGEGEPPVRNRVLPDNCIDVIFDLKPGGAVAPFVVGPMLRAEVHRLAGATDLLGVRFRPGAATEFLPIDAHELVHAHVFAGDVWADAGELTERLHRAPAAVRIALLDDYLQARRRERRDVPLARRATAAAERSRGTMTVRGLAYSLGVTERALQRAFDSAVGIGPKQLLKVQRFRAAASMIDAPRRLSLAAIAAACGYADQAHLTRDFVALAGLTPTAFRGEQSLVGIVQD